MTFDIQKFARATEDVTYRGRNRLAGNWGKLFVNGTAIFEIKSFECKITMDRENVIIGQDNDSKITSLTGEGSFTVVKVFTRGLNEYFSNIKSGHDERLVLVAEVADPDAVGGQKERIRIENVWFNEFTPMSFEKGAVIEQEITFGFTPTDLYFENSIDISGRGISTERH